MTVKELIETLKTYDANAKVWIGVNGKQYDEMLLDRLRVVIGEDAAMTSYLLSINIYSR